MNPRRADMPVAVFSRAPVAGDAKTRLVARLGKEGAAALQADLTRRALATAKATAIGPVQLWCSPDCTHAFFAQCAEEYGVMLFAQQGADLGARMHHAFVAALRHHKAALLIGADCPILSPGDIAAAARALKEGCDAVFTPAEDGGYVLVGLRRADSRIFEDIAWGGAGVMEQTRQRLRHAGWRWAEMPPRWDVDHPADLDRLAACGLFPLPRIAPAQ